jgi:hypothetical protein
MPGYAGAYYTCGKCSVLFEPLGGQIHTRIIKKASANAKEDTLT